MGRGREVPASGKHALTAWADAIGIDWPLSHGLISSAITRETNEEAKQAPAMSLEAVRKLGELAPNKEVFAYKRAFAAAVLLMTYDSLRFADARKIWPFESNGDSIYGTLVTSRTKKQHGLNWPRACPRKGILGTSEWAQPLIDERTAYRKVGGADLPYLFPRLGHNWQLVADGPSPYSTARRRLALACVGLGDEKGESYTLHSRENLLQAAANQMSFDQKELAIIGHWHSASKMPERYDRIVCPREPLLRNTTARKFAAGREHAAAYHLPTTVVGRVRFGKAEDENASAIETKQAETAIATQKPHIVAGDSPEQSTDTKQRPVSDTQEGDHIATALEAGQTELNVESPKPEQSKH